MRDDDVPSSASAVLHNMLELRLRRRRCLARQASLKVSRKVLAAVLVLVLAVWQPSATSVGLAGAGSDGESTDSEAQRKFYEKKAAVAAERMLRDCVQQLKPLQRQVDAGKIVGGFGKKADSILQDAAIEDSIEGTLDGALHALFLRQLALLRGELLERYSGSWARKEAAMEKADNEFVRRAEDLVRPGSSWSFEVDKELLRSSLEGTLLRDEALDTERRRGSLTRRSYFTLLGQMQRQLDKLGESLRGAGGASPWMVWTTYRIPRTPVLVNARYQPGRTNVQLSLATDEDPAKAEAEFVRGFRPAWLPVTNLGVSVDFGF